MLRALSLLVALGFIASLPEASYADGFSFSISNGHGHGHHHHGHHHHWHPTHCWDSHWCVPHVDYVYVAPRPVVRQHITYVQPAAPVVTESYQTRVAPPANQAWAGRSAAISSTTNNQVSAAAPVQIWNSNGRQARVTFLVNGQEVSLADGQSHTVYSAGTRVIEFDRGDDFGTARFELTGGEHEFVVTNNGWDLVEKRAGGHIATQPALKKNVLPR